MDRKLNQGALKYMNSTTLNPEISFIICTHTNQFITQCVKSLRSSFGIDYEIIIMSSDPSLKIDGCKVYFSKDTPAAKRNRASYYATGKYLCFLDDDVEVTPLCIRYLKRAMEKPYVGMVFSKLWNMQHRNLLDDAGSFLTKTGFLWSRAGQLEKDIGQYDKQTRVLAGKSACCMISYKLFTEVGGFDEDFGILGEETDLAWRVWLSGKEVFYVPRATGLHAFNTDLKPVDKHYTTERVQYNGCRNYITMLLKNLEARNLWRIMPIHITIWFFVGAAMLITGKLKQGWNIWKGIAYVMRNFKHIMRKRKSVQAARVISDSELLPLILRSTPRNYMIRRGLRYLRIGLHGAIAIFINLR